MALPQPASTIKGVALKHLGLHDILGVSRSSLYYRRKKPVEDWQIKQKIEIVLHDFPSYGHKRIAIALKLNKKKFFVLCASMALSHNADTESPGNEQIQRNMRYFRISYSLLRWCV